MCRGRVKCKQSLRGLFKKLLDRHWLITQVWKYNTDIAHSEPGFSYWDTQSFKSEIGLRSDLLVGHIKRACLIFVFSYSYRHK